MRAGETVVEVGSGAGLDAILAAQQVGPVGRVIGVDMTAAMLKKSRANAQLVGISNVEFREGFAEALPLPDSVADVVISNGVINLCQDKAVVYREIFRVLKPGGRLQIADIVVKQAVPDDAKVDIALCWKQRRPRSCERLGSPTSLSVRPGGTPSTVRRAHPAPPTLAPKALRSLPSNPSTAHASDEQSTGTRPPAQWREGRRDEAARSAAMERSDGHAHDPDTADRGGGYCRL